jgi:glyoxylase-like metal-dependent hydrolase (beta-lactamase superfamily II)
MKVSVESFGSVIRWVETPNTGVMDDPTNMVIIGIDPVLLIDPGSPAGVGAALAALEQIGSPKVEAILLTHIHIDHGGSAEELRQRLDAPVWFHEAELPELARASHDITLDRAIEHGEVIPFAGRRLEAILTPGHAAGHLSFIDLDDNLGIVGDLITGWGSSAIFPPFGDLNDYIASMDLLRERGVNPLLPSHGPLVTNGPEALRKFIERRRQREAEILRLLETGSMTIEEIRDRLYANVPQDLISDVTGNVVLHLEKLEREGRVRRETWADEPRFGLAPGASVADRAD